MRELLARILMMPQAVAAVAGGRLRPGVLHPALPVRLPAGARLLGSASTPWGAYADGEQFRAALTERLEQRRGGALDYTAYVLPPPWLFNPWNVAIAYFCEHLAAQHRNPITRHDLKARPATSCAQFFDDTKWILDLYYGFQGPHSLSLGYALSAKEVLLVVASPAGVAVERLPSPQP